MTPMSPEQVVADALAKFRGKAFSQFASRLDEAKVAVEALREAGYAVVKNPPDRRLVSVCQDCGAPLYRLADGSLSQSPECAVTNGDRL